MFRDTISNPIDPISVEYINTIERLTYEPDYSLTCLGIALLKSRISEYKGITGCYKNGTSIMSCVQNFIDTHNAYGNVPAYCYYTYTDEEEKENEAREVLSKEGYEFKDNISALLKEKANTKCIAAYHKEKNIAAIFVNSRNMQVYHLMISFLSILFPVIFKEHPMQEKDYELVKTLSKNEKNSFIVKIKEAVKPYAIEFKRIMLEKLLKSIHEQKIISARQNVDSQRDSVKYLEQQISDAIVELKRLIVVYEGMKATENFDKPEKDLVEYLANNKNVYGLSVSGSQISFCIQSLLNNFNENAWDVFAKAGFIFDGEYDGHYLEVFRTRNNRELLLNSIFSEDAEFSVKMCSNYKLDINDCRVYCSERFNYLDVDPAFEDCLANPHIKLFSCLGGYKDRIRRELEKRNYIGAIELCIASAGSINLDETTQVFRPFIGWILNSRNKILRRKDGVEMTPEEALIYLIDKEKENETTETE